MYALLPGVPVTAPDRASRRIHHGPDMCCVGDLLSLDALKAGLVVGSIECGGEVGKEIVEGL